MDSWHSTCGFCARPIQDQYNLNSSMENKDCSHHLHTLRPHPGCTHHTHSLCLVSSPEPLQHHPHTLWLSSNCAASSLVCPAELIKNESHLNFLCFPGPISSSRYAAPAHALPGEVLRTSLLSVIPILSCLDAAPAPAQKMISDKQPMEQWNQWNKSTYKVTSQNTNNYERPRGRNIAENSS